jgi:cAMP-dependent protein kinase regulator
MTEEYSPIVNQAKVVEMQRNRVSISAEVFGKFNCKCEYAPKVVPKDPQTKQHIQDRLCKAFMFMNLDDQEISVVIDAMDSKTIQADEFIIREKDPGEELYIVESGQLSCSKVIEGRDTFLKTYKSGDVFGELALLYNAPRAASIKAETQSQVWVLDRNTFNYIVKDSYSKKR